MLGPTEASQNHHQSEHGIGEEETYACTVPNEGISASNVVIRIIV